MSFKKYTYRNGKRYGPYLYENKRMGDKIVSTYLGHVPTKNYKKYFAFGFLIVLFLVLGVYFVGEIKFGKLFSPPREYSLISLGSLVEGELLIGKIDINLRRGECLPADTEVVASLDNVVEERLLSDVVSENVMECDFYLEETSVSGSGNGFGVEGEKEIFPEINFELMFLKDDADEISSTPLIGGGQSDNQEAAEEVEKAVEEKAIDEETIDETPVEEEEKTVDEEETADETPIEEVVEEERAVDEVEKEVVKEEPKSESGKVEEVGDELVISTDYSIIENGFGEEFLGEEIYNFNFDLREFGFIIGKGLLQVDFEYNGEELFGSEGEILFDSELLADEKNETAPEIVNDINITLPEINETAIPEVINETNATIPEINITISDKNETNATQIGQARIGLPVKWAIRKKAEIGSNVVDIPESATNVVVSKLEENDGESERREISEEELETSEDVSPALGSDEERIVDDKILLAPSSRKKINVDISSDGIVENLIVEYETPAPFIASEELNENGKKIIVSSGVEELHYNDVLVFTNIDENLNVIDKSRVKIFWVENSDGIVPTSVEDKDGNGVYDYIEFIAPHLSNQTFNIIVITKAEHLDNNRSFISDIFEEVRELDGIWSETINDGEYVRVTFEIPLDSSRDITVWPRIVSGNPRIEVYEAEGNEVIAEFTSLNDDEYNKVYLTNLGQGQCYDNETEILTGDGWKYFYELEDEKVATLNSESGKLEWEEPLDKQVFEHDGEMFRIELNSHISEELGFDSNFDGCVEHLFVVCDKNRVCNFGTSDKNSIKTRTHCDRAEVNTLLDHFSIGNNITGEINNKFSNLFSDIFVSSKSGRYTSSLNYSDNLNNNFNFFIVHFINERGSKIVNPELFFGDRVLFSSSWLNESFNDNAGIKDMTHKSYSLSRISLTNSVGSSYDSMSSNNSLISSNDGESLCFFNFNNDMIMCSSLSMFSNFLTNSLSSINNDIENSYINFASNSLLVSPKHKVYVSINGEDFDLIPITEAYESINSGKEVYFLDAEGNKIKVNSITKENYSGKIYDVDVENDIVLVRRGEERCDSGIKENVSESLFVNPIMMVKIFKNDHIVFYLKNENETSELYPLKMAEVVPEVFEMLNRDFVAVCNLSDFVLESTKECEVFPFELLESSLYFRNVNSHNELQNLLNSSILIDLSSDSLLFTFNFSIYSSLTSNSSIGDHSNLSQNSWSSFVSSPVLVNLSNISRFINRTIALAKNSDSNFNLGLINSFIENNIKISYINLSLEGTSEKQKVCTEPKAFWSGNSDNYTQDTFDLLIKDGSVEFEHVVDPLGTCSGTVHSCTAHTSEGPVVCNTPAPNGPGC